MNIVSMGNQHANQGGLVLESCAASSRHAQRIATTEANAMMGFALALLVSPEKSARKECVQAHTQH